MSTTTSRTDAASSPNETGKPGLTASLAALASELTLRDLPAEACERARLAIADCIGSALAGVSDEAARIARAAIGREGGASRVWGTSLSASPRDAALANGTAAHALAIDDTNESMKGHPSAPIVPALLALGEAVDAGGEALLAAYVAGVEVAARLGRAVNPRHAEVGWHTTMTLGTVGAAAGAGKLLRLDAGSMRHAIGIATSMAGGSRANFGTMTKALGPGLAAQGGILAATLASRGFTANPDALESREGFIDLFCGAGQAHPARGLQRGAPFEIERPSVVFKLYPNCSLIHTTIDMVLDGVAAGEIDPGAVEGVTVSISPRLDRMRVKGQPATVLQAKFSVEYAVACALLRRSVGLSEFTDEVFQDEAIAAMMARVAVRIGDGFGEDNGDLAGILVEHKGRPRWSRALAKPRGHWTNPLPNGVLERKFLAGASGVLGDEQAATTWTALNGLEKLDCRVLVGLLVPPA